MPSLLKSVDSRHFMKDKGAMLFTPPVITLIFLSFVMGTSEFIVIGTLTEISQDLKIDEAVMGSLVSMFAVSYVIGTPVIASLTSRINKFKVIMTLTVLFGLSNLLPLLSDSFAILAVSRIVTAAVSGALLSVGMAMSIEFTTAANRAKTLAWIYTGFSISSVTSIPIGAAMSRTVGWRSAFVMIVVLTIIAVLAVIMTLPHDSAPKARVERGGRSSIGLMKDTRIVMGIMMTTMSVCGIYVFYTFVTPIMEYEMGIPGEMISVCLLIYGVACIISNLSSAKVAERGGLRRLPLVFGVQAVLMAALSVSFGHGAIGMVIIFGVGLTMYLLNATSQMHFLEVAVRDHPDSVNLASSLNPVAFNIGTAIGSAVGSVVVSTSGLSLLGYCSAFFSAMAMLCVLMLLKIERNPGKRTSLA
jgi:DHA1 family inner membrane transport protein